MYFKELHLISPSCVCVVVAYCLPTLPGGRLLNAHYNHVMTPRHRWEFLCAMLWVCCLFAYFQASSNFVIAISAYFQATQLPEFSLGQKCHGGSCWLNTERNDGGVKETLDNHFDHPTAGVHGSCEVTGHCQPQPKRISGNILCIMSFLLFKNLSHDSRLLFNSSSGIRIPFYWQGLK